MADQVKLFVGGLPDSFGEEELRELFSPHGVVREAVILASKSTSGQKCGFVCYQARTAQEMAAAAIATLSDRHCPPGVDKPIQVSVAKNSAAAGKACGRRDSSWHAAAAFPSGGPPASLEAAASSIACQAAYGWPIGGLEAAASSMACPPQPQPVVGQPGVSYCGAAASPMHMAYLPPSPPCGAAVGPGVGMGAAGVGGVGGALPGAPSPPQFVPHSQPPPHAHPTVQENPAGSSGMPVKLFVGSLPGGATTAAVQQIFTPFGQIHEIHLMAPSAKTGDRCAFVSFLSTAAAQAAVEQLDGRFQVPPSPRTIVVQLAKESNKRPRA